jgi:hypothetical protein
MFIMIIITFYAGELVWEERGLKMDQIYDVLPIPNWVMTSSKVFGMFYILIFLMIVLMLTCIGIQIGKGFFEFDLSVYLKDLFGIRIWFYFMVAVLAILVQTIVTNKMAGHGIMVFYYVVVFLTLYQAGFQHVLYKYPITPQATYSAMNGYGHFLTAVRWVMLYWGFLAALLFIITSLLWNRGTETSLKNRLKLAHQRMTKPIKISMSILLCAFILTGAYIFYNTNILNKYLTTDDNEKDQVAYEKTYKKFAHNPQPKIVDVKVNVDLYPSERNLFAQGSYILKNKSTSPIDSVHLSINAAIEVRKFAIGNSTIILEDKKLGYYILKLEKSLQPHDSVKFDFDVAYISKGFKNREDNTQIVYNGTFINNTQFLPSIGYQTAVEMHDRDKRKKEGLPPRDRMSTLTDTTGRQFMYFIKDGDWINFETVVSTSDDQIPLAPGYLVKEWKENGRVYRNYKMDSKIINFYAFLSARYEVKRDKWNDVNLEIYYHKGHKYNVDRMITAMKNSLNYYVTNFSPFQFRQLRIIEFPRYEQFAQSFSNTIPYSESIGFIANLSKEDAIDYVYYVTAHEIAHQWWAHQVIGGYVQGTDMIVESLSQYSALMVMEKQYGKDKMRKFLKYELDRYLRGRRQEQERENPLMLCEGQGYIHYDKGGVIMYALKDYIGEDTLNKTLAAYIQKNKFQEPPFTISSELVEAFRNATPDSLKYIITDMFETITLFNNRVKEAKYMKMPDGKYKVRLEVESQKFRADSIGRETEIPMNDYIDIAVFGNEMKDGKKTEKPLYFAKRKITGKENIFELTVDTIPVKAGIDPYNKLIDRVSDDNDKKTEEVKKF